MNRTGSWSRATVLLTALLLTTILTLTSGQRHALAWEAPTLDGKMDDVYLLYGNQIRYADVAPHTLLGEGDLPAAYLYWLEDEDYVYVFYHQDMYNANDMSYGANSIHWENKKNHKRDFMDIVESDKGEFSFFDATGAIAGHFYADQLSEDESGTTPSGYVCGGVIGGPDDDSSPYNDGEWMDPLPPEPNIGYFEVRSTLAYNLNETGYCSGGVCTCAGTNLLEDSPPTTGTYEPVPGCEEWLFYNGWEIRVDKDVFGTLGFGIVLGTHHNSPSKVCASNDGCEPETELSISSIGDRVWWDMNRNGIQETGEPGLAGVTVNLIDPRDGRLIESQITKDNGYYLFDQLSNTYYIVEVDELTLPTGFVTTYVEPACPPYPIDYYTSHENDGSDCLPDPPSCIQRDGQTYDNVYYIDLDWDEHYRTADFGYAPNGAAIGDFVWYDDSNYGIQDTGEIGIEGVVLELINPADDSVIATTTTDVTGWYLFAGLDAGDYRVQVRVDGGDAGTGTILTDYTHTVGPESRPSPTAVITLTENQIYVSADFGYYKETGLGTIGDYVWFDTNNDGIQDAGEPPAANVTLALYKDTGILGLLEAGDEYIAETVTAANGTYLFSGLPVDDGDGDANYLVKVTDTNGVLTGYSITTYWDSDDPQPLGVPLNRYNDPCPAVLTPSAKNFLFADFGYNRPGSIGDTVWLDLNQDGIQDANELGVGGVTVYLTGTQSATTTTRPDGTYLFTGLSSAPGNSYQVSIDIPAGYSLSLCTTIPCPNPHYSVTLTGNQSYLDADFGLFRTDIYTLGDFIWRDDNEDGHWDSGSEPGIGNVTVALYRDECDGNPCVYGTLGPNDILLGETTTDSSGYYIFEGLLPGTYLVDVTDDWNTLDGYTKTSYETYFPAYENTSNYSQDLPLAVEIIDADIDYADFGYVHPTLVLVTAFTAFEKSGSTVVQWETGSEVGTVGFHLKRMDPDTGKFFQVNEDLLPGLLVYPQGGIYRYVDTGAQPGGTYTYKLVEVEAKGKTYTYGPFTVFVEKQTGNSNRMVQRASLRGDIAGYTSEPHGMSEAQKARNEAAKAAKQAAKQKKKKQKGDTCKIMVNQNGLYYIDAADMADIFGTTLKKVQNYIQDKYLVLSNQGETVAWLPAQDNGGIYFYGMTIESIYTYNNVYWLEIGKKNQGIVMKQVGGQGPDPADNGQSYMDSVHVEEDAFPMPALFDDPEGDFWLWTYLFAGTSKTFNINTPGASGTGTASLRVTLQGATDTEADPDHHVKVLVNNTPVGEGTWDGTAAYELNTYFDAAILKSDAASVKLEGIKEADVLYSIFYLDSVDLAYSRYFQAIDNTLLCTGNGNHVVTIQGFIDPDIMLFELSDPMKPMLVTAVTIGEQGSDYQVSFVPASAQTPYLAISASAAIYCEEMWADAASSLTDRNNRVDYLVIAPLETMDGAQALADYRQGQGLDTMVADLDDIYDEFNHGLATPHAIREFLAYAYGNWKKPPTYVVLAGDGTYDYKDVFGSGDNVVPALMVNTPHGLFDSDNLFVDIEGNDGRPEMAIGRLPVVTSEELYMVLDKIMAYESAYSDDWTKRVLMLADNPDEGGNFPADSDQVADLIPPEYTVDKIYLSELNIKEARDLLLGKINDGTLLLTYIGHGGVDRLAQEGILSISDVAFLENGERTPILTAMTCIVGRFTIPGFSTLAESLLLHGSGGVIAVWGPTGLSLNSEAKKLDEEFFLSVFGNKDNTLGLAVMEALEGYSVYSSSPFMMDIYNLLGDPALKIK